MREQIFFESVFIKILAVIRKYAFVWEIDWELFDDIRILYQIRQESAGGRSEIILVLKRMLAASLVRLFDDPCGIGFLQLILLKFLAVIRKYAFVWGID